MKISFNKISLPESTIKAVVRTLESGWLINGPKTLELENYFKVQFNKKFSLATSSATSGLHLVLKSLQLDKDSEVVVPTMTFTATASAVLYAGLRMRFCDVEVDTLNIDVSYLETMLKNDLSNKIKVVIVVHVAGNPVNLKKIIELKKKI